MKKQLIRESLPEDVLPTLERNLRTTTFEEFIAKLKSMLANKSTGHEERAAAKHLMPYCELRIALLEQCRRYAVLIARAERPLGLPIEDETSPTLWQKSKTTTVKLIAADAKFAIRTNTKLAMALVKQIASIATTVDGLLTKVGIDLDDILRTKSCLPKTLAQEAIKRPAAFPDDRPADQSVASAPSGSHKEPASLDAKNVAPDAGQSTDASSATGAGALEAMDAGTDVLDGQVEPSTTIGGSVVNDALDPIAHPSPSAGDPDGISASEGSGDARQDPAAAKDDPQASSNLRQTPDNSHRNATNHAAASASSAAESTSPMGHIDKTKKTVQPEIHPFDASDPGNDPYVIAIFEKNTVRFDVSGYPPGYRPQRKFPPQFWRDPRVKEIRVANRSFRRKIDANVIQAVGCGTPKQRDVAILMEGYGISEKSTAMITNRNRSSVNELKKRYEANTRKDGMQERFRKAKSDIYRNGGYGARE